MSSPKTVSVEANMSREKGGVSMFVLLILTVFGEDMDRSCPEPRELNYWAGLTEMRGQGSKDASGSHLGVTSESAWLWVRVRE